MSITVLIPTSPIPDHPSTEMIDETIKSVRDRIPGSEIIIMFDGVRRVQFSKRGLNYEEYVRQMLYKYRDDALITPLYFSEQTHQAGMTRKALEIIDTDAVLFMEHDTPLIGDIDFDVCLSALRVFNVVRFSHEAVIPEPHWEYMLDNEPASDFIRTAQWSQRPHLARTEFYRWIIHEYFGAESNTMIEDTMWPVVKHHYDYYGLSGWEKFKIALYAPTWGDIKRSDNLDGRGLDPKYPMKYKYDGEVPWGAPPGEED